MKLADIRTVYQQRSTTASAVCRQLAFAGIGLVWLFRIDPKAAPAAAQLDTELILPGVLLVAGLSLDLIQYLYASFAWGLLNRILEKRGFPRDQEFRVHPAINWPALLCFWGKLFSISLAYLAILFELSERLLLREV